jgi:hypothetical protein
MKTGVSFTSPFFFASDTVEVFVFVRYNCASVGDLLTTFRKNVIVSSSNVEKSNDFIVQGYL